MNDAEVCEQNRELARKIVVQVTKELLSPRDNHHARRIVRSKLFRLVVDAFGSYCNGATIDDFLAVRPSWSERAARISRMKSALRSRIKRVCPECGGEILGARAKVCMDCRHAEYYGL